MTTNDVFVELQGGAEALLREYLVAAEAAQVWDARKDELAKELIAYMGVAKKATIGGRHVVTRIGNGTVNSFSVSRFKQAYPDLYRDFVVPTPRTPYLRVVV